LIRRGEAKCRSREQQHQRHAEALRVSDRMTDVGHGPRPIGILRLDRHDGVRTAAARGVGFANDVSTTNACARYAPALRNV
jgi:hypothetical protein